MNGSGWLAAATGLTLFLFAMQQLEQSLHGLLGGLRDGLSESVHAFTTLDEQAQHQAMETLLRHVYDHVEEARESGISALNLARELDECPLMFLSRPDRWDAIVSPRGFLYGTGKFRTLV